MSKNIVFITVDSLRYDYVLGPRAPESLKTLPRLVNEGLSFTNAFTNAPYTNQSFLSVLSGTHPWMYNGQEGGFEPERPHVAEMLSESGYATAGFHTNTYLSPAYNYDRGFDYYMGRDVRNRNRDGTNGSKSIVETTYSRLAEKAVTIGGVSDIVHKVYKSTGKRLGIQLGSSLYKPASQLNDEIIQWTEQTTHPVFVWAHYMDVHNPYYPHEGTVSEGISRRKAVKLFHRVNELGSDASDQDLEILERLYRGEIQYFDRQLGDLLDRLDTTLDLENTLIVFSSDHGEAFNEKGCVFHPGSALYDENIHIPMIVRGPGIENAVVDTPVSNADLVPTILSEVGLEPPASIVGKDLTSFVSEKPEERLIFTESYSRENGNLMVTDGRYKLVRDLDTGEQSLYDRHEQPKEIHDRIDEFPDVRDKLVTAVEEHIRSVDDTEAEESDFEITEDVRLQLRKLGYDE